MATTIILPGVGGSGDAHWQTHWENSTTTMERFKPTSWDAPVLEDWLAALDRAVADAVEPPLLVAHSLACLLVAHWSDRPASTPIRGAFLVAVPDPAAPAFPSEAGSFRNVPDRPLRFPTLIVASEDDPYGSPTYSRSRANAWGSGFVIAGRLGHINGASALGDWPLGRMLFESFRAGTGMSRRPDFHAG